VFCSAQVDFTNKDIHFLSFLLVLFKLLRQFHLSQALVLIGRILPQLINLIFLDPYLLTPSQNSSIVKILIINWLTYLVRLLIHLILIKLLAQQLILRELNPIFLTLLVVLSLTNSLILQ